MIAFLIDADNFSAPAWIDEAFHRLEHTEGAIAIRRAYGSAENLKGLADTLRVWAIRPFVNLSLPKNTTDMSLAVDAMELACASPVPKLMVIGSGDSDFVPLVVRLREKGIRVICVSEQSKMAEDALRAYDLVIYVGDDQTPRRLTPSSKKFSPVAEVSAAADTSKKTQRTPAKKSDTVKLTAEKTATKKVAKKAATATSKEVNVAVILAAVPNLKSGEWQPLGEIAKLLHDKRILAKSATSTKLLKKFPHHFELMPEGKPNRVRFILP